MNKQIIEQIFEQFNLDQPNPTTELNYKDAYTLLIAVVMSAQTTDAAVNKVTAKLFELAETPQAMLDLGLEKLTEIIKSIGLYKTKAKHVYRLSEILVEKYQGEVPRDREQLENLPGVGRKTANVVLNTVWGEHTIAVDTHVFRVANRVGLTKEKTPKAVELKLMKVIPARFLRHAHHHLILHGRYVCKARNPLCTECKIEHLCEFQDKKLF